MFNDKLLRKTRNANDFAKEKRLKKSMVETIQQFWKTEIQVERSATFIEGWNTTWQAIAS